MELKEFIKTAISDITGAISELQSNLDNGTIVNPTLTQGARDKCVMRDNAIIPIEHLNFDIAVTATEASDADGGAKVGISVFGVKVGAETSSKHENASRLTFSIPVVFPATHVKTQAEKLHENRPKGPN